MRGEAASAEMHLATDGVIRMCTSVGCPSTLKRHVGTHSSTPVSDKIEPEVITLGTEGAGHDSRYRRYSRGSCSRSRFVASAGLERMSNV